MTATILSLTADLAEQRRLNVALAEKLTDVCEKLARVLNGDNAMASNIEWQEWEDSELSSDGPECEAGDRFLVLIEAVSRHSNGKKTIYWDSQVIVACEDGWENSDGDSWSAWSWSDVSRYLKLDAKTLPPHS